MRTSSTTSCSALRFVFPTGSFIAWVYGRQAFSHGFDGSSNTGRVARSHRWDTSPHAFVQHANVVVEGIIGSRADLELFTSAAPISTY